jgi:hypothetical protein
MFMVFCSFWYKSKGLAVSRQAFQKGGVILKSNKLVDFLGNLGENFG